MKFFVLVVLAVSFVFGSIDINSAGIKELTSLKGIGNKKAAAIIEYRALHCFKSVDELAKVKGIGKKFLDKHREALTAGKCHP